MTPDETNRWIDIFTHYPVILVACLGLVFSWAFTYFIKKLVDPSSVDLPRFIRSVRILAATSGFGFTYGIWHYMIPEDSKGLVYIVSVGMGFCSSPAYMMAIAISRVFFPRVTDALSSRTNKPRKQIVTDTGTYQKITPPEDPNA